MCIVERDIAPQAEASRLRVREALNFDALHP